MYVDQETPESRQIVEQETPESRQIVEQLRFSRGADSRSLPYDEDRISQISHRSGSQLHVSDREDSNTAKVVVQINDEINGKITPRVIVSINDNNKNGGVVGQNSYVKNRLKPYENGYLSGEQYDSDHSYRSVHSHRSRSSNGRSGNRLTDRVKSSLRRSGSEQSIGRADGYRSDRSSRRDGYTSDRGSKRDGYNSDRSNKGEGHFSDCDSKLQSSRTNGYTSDHSIRSDTYVADNKRNDGERDGSGSRKLYSEATKPGDAQPYTAKQEESESASQQIDKVSNSHGEESSDTGQKKNDGSDTFRKDNSDVEKDYSSKNGILSNSMNRSDSLDPDDATKKKPKEVKWSDEVKDVEEEEVDQTGSGSKVADDTDRGQGQSGKSQGDVPSYVTSDWDIIEEDEREEKPTEDQRQNERETTNIIDVPIIKVNPVEENEIPNKKEDLNANDSEKRDSRRQSYDASQSFVKSDTDTVPSSHYNGDVSDAGDVNDLTNKKKVRVKHKPGKVKINDNNMICLVIYVWHSH